MIKFILLLNLVLVGCVQLPVSPSDLKPSPDRSSDIHTQEALLPNTTYQQISQRMKEYADKCLNTWHEESCGRGCKTLIKFTATIIKDKNKQTLFLQKKGGAIYGETPINGIYLMMAEVLASEKTQQVTVHGFDSRLQGYTTQATIDWLSDRKKECPKL